jgi:hypothetical protein
VVAEFQEGQKWEQLIISSHTKGLEADSSSSSGGVPEPKVKVIGPAKEEPIVPATLTS